MRGERNTDAPRATRRGGGGGEKADEHAPFSTKSFRPAPSTAGSQPTTAADRMDGGGAERKESAKMGAEAESDVGGVKRW